MNGSSVSQGRVSVHDVAKLLKLAILGFVWEVTGPLSHQRCFVWRKKYTKNKKSMLKQIRWVLGETLYYRGSLGFSPLSRRLSFPQNI